MVNKIIEEINKALDNNLYIIALTSALTLPDICGKAEYPNIKSTSTRYKKWYQENIGNYEINPYNIEHNIDMPYLSADVVYSLRCYLLHQGTPNIKENLNIKFDLIIEKKNELNIYSDSASCGSDGKTYSVSIRRLCCILCWTAEEYYNKNKEKFNFFNYSITDIDAEIERINNAYKEIDKKLKD